MGERIGRVKTTIPEETRLTMLASLKPPWSIPIWNFFDASPSMMLPWNSSITLDTCLLRSASSMCERRASCALIFQRMTQNFSCSTERLCKRQCTASPRPTTEVSKAVRCRWWRRRVTTTAHNTHPSKSPSTPPIPQHLININGVQDLSPWPPIVEGCHRSVQPFNWAGGIRTVAQALAPW